MKFNRISDLINNDTVFKEVLKMIAKLTDGVLTFAPKKITFTNPNEELLKTYAGYKNYVEADKPEYDPKTQRLVPQYSETDTEITCSWEIEEIPEDEQIQGIDERISNLETEVSGISDAIKEGLDV